MDVDKITTEELQHFVRSDDSWVLDYLREKTVFDADRIGRLLSLGRQYAAKLIDDRNAKVDAE